jgi:glyoxylase-like metal-dependent hydrolase (beta-lactamase superfamily II)
MQPVDLACPVSVPTAVTVEVAVTATLASDWKDVVDDGRKGALDLPLLVGLVRHPDGVVAVDSGMGQTTRDGTFPRFPLNGFEVTVPEGATLKERVGMPLRVLLTHPHYDHVGGLFDLPGVEVWTSAADAAAYFPGNVHWPAALRRIASWRVIDFAPGVAARVLGRPAIDVMGDGTVWYLSTPGHTPGAASVLVLATDGPWLFVGDTAWVDDHLKDARRPFTSALLVDADRPNLDESLDWARWIAGNCPDVKVVAGHEPKWAK